MINKTDLGYWNKPHACHNRLGRDLTYKQPVPNNYKGFKRVVAGNTKCKNVLSVTRYSSLIVNHKLILIILSLELRIIEIQCLQNKFQCQDKQFKKIKLAYCLTLFLIRYFLSCGTEKKGLAQLHNVHQLFVERAKKKMLQSSFLIQLHWLNQLLDRLYALLTPCIILAVSLHINEIPCVQINLYLNINMIIIYL